MKLEIMPTTVLCSIRADEVVSNFNRASLIKGMYLHISYTSSNDYISKKHKFVFHTTIMCDLPRSSISRPKVEASDDGMGDQNMYKKKFPFLSA